RSPRPGGAGDHAQGGRARADDEGELRGEAGRPAGARGAHRARGADVEGYRRQGGHQGPIDRNLRERRERMPHLTTDDGVKLYYEEVGAGIPIVFVHEFAGDVRSWEPQLRYFGRRYRCIAYNARGYPPSDVPGTVDKYSQDRARDDIRAVLDALKI